MDQGIQTKLLKPTSYNQPILLFQSKYSRAINVGFIETNTFIPGRQHYGVSRMQDTRSAMIQTLQVEIVNKILKKYSAKKISTVTVIREAIAYQVPEALFEVLQTPHYGDAFVGATHIKKNGKITSAYGYENVEGLIPSGLWILADSICMGRNLSATMGSLLAKFQPQEMLFLCPLASRKGIEIVGKISAAYNIPTTFVAWGALFGVGNNDYDMPWGHPDTEVLDERDKKMFINMYSDKMCVGGDFGNYYFAPPLAKKFYEDQLQELGIVPKIPTVEEIEKIYSSEEILIQ